MAKIVVFGVTGQDGYYLTQHLLGRGDNVIGVMRRTSGNNLCRIQPFLKHVNFTAVNGDVTDFASVRAIINKHMPDEVYNLAAQSHVAVSFEQPILTWDITAKGCINILDAILTVSPSIKFYQASSSEMFGSSYTDDGDWCYQDENTPFQPCSPYGIAKLAAHHAVGIYRAAYGMFACSGILFNHESPKRGDTFLTKKVTNYIGQLKNFNTKEKLVLGNLNSYRDMGHAYDYVRAMTSMMSYYKADDYVIATGATIKIEDFVKKAFDVVGLNYLDHIVISDTFKRPKEVDYLCGKATKAEIILGWKPTISFDDLVKEMVMYALV